MKGYNNPANPYWYMRRRALVSALHAVEELECGKLSPPYGHHDEQIRDLVKELHSKIRAHDAAGGTADPNIRPNTDSGTTDGGEPKPAAAAKLPLLGSNQDSPDPEAGA